jgi:hypothetical protein
MMLHAFAALQTREIEPMEDEEDERRAA